MRDVNPYWFISDYLRLGRVTFRLTISEFIKHQNETAWDTKEFYL